MENEITVNVALDERTYPIHIAIGALDALGKEAVKHSKSQKAVIITDSNVLPIYGDIVKRRLTEEGLAVSTIVLNPGEDTKSLTTIASIYDSLLEKDCDRYTVIVALGGGVIGDAAGFAASTYLRGISFLQVPTTLLSQVDSSVGGKVGINYKGYKNIVGSFYQPKAVIADTGTLATLPKREFSNGMAEVIKTALLSGGHIWQYLNDKLDRILALDRAALGKIIAACCDYKAQVVQIDERESGYRRILNLGHTLGHAIEAQDNLDISHGEAVAIGIAFACFVGRTKGTISGDIYKQIIDILQSSGLPVKLPDLKVDNLVNAILKDKKMEAGVINFVIIEGPGKPAVITMSGNEIKQFITAFKEEK